MDVRDKDADLKARAIEAFVDAAAAVDTFVDNVEKWKLFKAIEIGADGALFWRSGYEPPISDEALQAGEKAFNEVFEKAAVKPTPISSPLPEPKYIRQHWTEAEATHNASDPGGA